MTPAWTPRYATISKLFTCDLMLHIIHKLLGSVVARRAKLRAESHFERVLHLITLALHEDKRLYLAGDTRLQFVTAAQSYSGPRDLSGRAASATASCWLYLCLRVVNLSRTVPVH